MTKTVERFVLKDGQLARLEKAGESIGDLSNRLFDLTGKVQDLWKDIKAAVAQTRQPIHPAPTTHAALQSPHARRVAPVAPATSRRPARVVSEAADAGELSSGGQRILETIAMLNARELPVTRESVARWLSLHPNGGRYNRNLAQLRAAGILDGLEIVKPVGPFALDVGLDAALAALPDDTKRRTLRTIADAGRRLTREALAELMELHPNGGRFNRDLAWLRTMGLIPERGDIYLTEGATR